MTGRFRWTRLAVLGLLLVPSAAFAQQKFDEGSDPPPAPEVIPTDSTSMGGADLAGRLGLDCFMSQSGDLILYGQPGSAFAYVESAPPMISLREPSGASARMGESQAEALPLVFALGRGAPNPFGTSMSVKFDLPVASRVQLEVLDIQGRRLTSLVDGELPPGTHTRIWRGTDAAGRTVSPGMYFLRIDAHAVAGTDGLRKVEKILRLR